MEETLTLAIEPTPKGKRWNVINWDICRRLHTMSDMGIVNGKFGRPRTAKAECYAAHDGIKCHRGGVCIKARLRHEHGCSPVHVEEE